MRPGKTRDELTAQAAQHFASLAERLRGRGHDPQEVAHFLNKLLFCMFAEDAGLLPSGLLRRLAAGAQNDAAVFTGGLSELFSKMSEHGGLFGAERIQWFNGGLFDGGRVVPLTPEEIHLVEAVSRLDWSQVEPAIFGTLFERGLDPSKRSQLGRPLHRPLLDHAPHRARSRDSSAPGLRTDKEQVLALVAEGKKITARTPMGKNPLAVFNAFLERLRAVRVLDPACGSGNFLYLALQTSRTWSARRSCGARSPLRCRCSSLKSGPQALLGIELNTYAAELARVVIWIGEIQWMLSQRVRLLARSYTSAAQQHRMPRCGARPSRPGRSP